MVNDTKCIEHVKQIMESTPGFHIVYDRGASYWTYNDGDHVNDERRKFESDFGISFPVIRKEYSERPLNQAQQDREKEQSIQQDVHGENQNTFQHVKVKVPPKPYEPTKEERQSHEAPHCPCRAWCVICVKAKSPDGKYARQVVNPEHIPVIEFDYAFATDAPGGPKISMMVATDVGIHTPYLHMCHSHIISLSLSLCTRSSVVSFHISAPHSFVTPTTCTCVAQDALKWSICHVRPHTTSQYVFQQTQFMDQILLLWHGEKVARTIM